MARSVPANDQESVKTFEFDGEVYTMKTKFKIFKFFKELDKNPITAIAMVLDEDSVSRLEEKDMDMDDFKALLEIVSENLSGTSSGN